jgi:hypothetical protein
MEFHWDDVGRSEEVASDKNRCTQFTVICDKDYSMRHVNGITVKDHRKSKRDGGDNYNEI